MPASAAKFLSNSAAQTSTEKQADQLGEGEGGLQTAEVAGGRDTPARHARQTSPRAQLWPVGRAG